MAPSAIRKNLPLMRGPTQETTGKETSSIKDVDVYSFHSDEITMHSSWHPTYLMFADCINHMFAVQYNSESVQARLVQMNFPVPIITFLLDPHL
jgi:hypothetical protein